MDTRLLILSFYFRPDLSAGSFRASALVSALLAKLPPDAEIDVVTTLPNRYHTFATEAPPSESTGGLTVRRIALPPHRSGMLDQSRAFLSYAWHAFRFTSRRRYDIVFATSSRLMTAVLGAFIATRKGARLYLDIRDIFADTIKDVLKGARGRLAWWLFSALEQFAIRRAARVNLVSPGFLEYFRTRYPTQQFSCYSNAIDDEFSSAAPATSSPSPLRAGPRTPTLLYAGNIGEGQGLASVVPQMAKALGDRVRFRIIGDGGRAEALRREISAAGVRNVDIVPPVGREQLIREYRDADVLFLHLNDVAAFKKVLPSKIFEYAAMGKPILAGVSGYAAEFLRSEVSNAAVFQPCDPVAAVEALPRLQLVDTPRTSFLARYSRREISARLADDVVAASSSARRPAAR